MVLLCHSSECGLFSVPSLFCLLGLLPRYNRQGRKVLDLREQVQHENAKSAQYRDQQLPYCTQREQQCDQRLRYLGLFVTVDRGVGRKGMK